MIVAHSGPVTVFYLRSDYERGQMSAAPVGNFRCAAVVLRTRLGGQISFIEDDEHDSSSTGPKLGQRENGWHILGEPVVRGGQRAIMPIIQQIRRDVRVIRRCMIGDVSCQLGERYRVGRLA